MINERMNKNLSRVLLPAGFMQTENFLRAAAYEFGDSTTLCEMMAAKNRQHPGVTGA
jgi:hypothetical protein